MKRLRMALLFFNSAPMPYRHLILDPWVLKKQIIRVKKAELQILKTEVERDQAIQKHHNTLRAFQVLDIIPDHSELLNGHHLRHHLVDRSGVSHYRYALGMQFPHQKELHHYVEVFGKGAGEAIHTSVEKKEVLDRIEVLSGICLFGSGRLKFDFGSQKRVSLTDRNLEIKALIKDIHEDSRFSIYEVDGILGLSGFMNALNFHNKNIDRIHLEIPNIQYYLYLAQAYEDGYISASLYTKYMTLVDQRGDRVLHHLVDQLDIASVNRTSTLSDIQEYLQHRVAEGQSLELSKLQGLLSQDPVWSLALEYHEVLDWEDLMYLSYIVTVLKLGEKKSGRTLLQIDDPIEQKILLKSGHFIKKLGKENYRIWGLYPVQKVFLNPDHTEESDLYYNEDLPMDPTIMQRIFEVHGKSSDAPHFGL